MGALGLVDVAAGGVEAFIERWRDSGANECAMQRVRRQAEGYAEALTTAYGWTLFLLSVDVGHAIECLADFSLTGKNYSRFLDAGGFKIRLDIIYRAIEQSKYKRRGKAATGARETQNPKPLAPIHNMPDVLEPDVETSRYRAISARGNGNSGRKRSRHAPARLLE